MLKSEKKNELPNELFDFLQRKYQMKFIKKLGKGNFGEVHQILFKNAYFAIKIFKNNPNNNREKKIRNEIHFSFYLTGNNIIRTLKTGNTIIDGQKYFFLFMEKKFIDLGLFIINFFKYNILKIKNSTKNFSWIYNFSEETIRLFSYQIIESLRFLDNHSIIHFDLKPENLLLDDNFIIKLSDFSQVSQFNYKQKSISIQNGTYCYMSPEFYNQEKEVSISIGKTLDFFSFGCILYYMISREDLIKANFNKGKIIKPTKIEVENYINQGIEKMKTINYCNELKELIEKLININPEKRPKINDLIMNDWVNKKYVVVKKIQDINFNQKLKIIVELQKVSYIMKFPKKRRKYYIE